MSIYTFRAINTVLCGGQHGLGLLDDVPDRQDPTHVRQRHAAIVVRGCKNP